MPVKHKRVFLLDLNLSPENRELVENFTTIMDKSLSQRIHTLNKYGLRKNRNFHTLVFKTLIITKFGYRRNKMKFFSKENKILLKEDGKTRF